MKNLTPEKPTLKNLISRQGIADHFKVSYQTVWKWERLGKMACKPTRVGKADYFPIAVLKKIQPQKANEMEEDIYYIRKARPVFEYPELLINFYQPARLNRKTTANQLLERKSA